MSTSFPEFMEPKESHAWLFLVPDSIPPLRRCQSRLTSKTSICPVNTGSGCLCFVLGYSIQPKSKIAFNNSKLI